MKTGRSLTALQLSLCAIGMAALGWGGCNRQPDISDLVRAVDGHRLFAPRLSGGFPQEPCREPPEEASRVRLADCAHTLDRLALREITRLVERLRSASGRRADAATLHVLGIGELLAGSPERAVRRLEEASAQDSTDAEILSDLSAAYLVRAEARDDPRDLIRALGRTLAALRQNPHLPEALFNKALALESLGLGSAAPAWREAARSEMVPGWAAEAQAHANRLDRKTLAWRWKTARMVLEQAAQRGDLVGIRDVVTRFPQATRLAVEEEMLPLWAVASRTGQTGEAHTWWVLATATANALRDTGRDSLLADTITKISAIQRDGDPARLDLLLAGFAAYHDGVDAYAKDRIDLAAAQFAIAQKHLKEGGSPFAIWTMVYLANCDYRREKYVDALDKLNHVLRQPGIERYPSLRGRALWIEGVTRLSLAQPADALRAYRLSLASFAAARERESVATLHTLIASALGYIGEEREACRQLYHALRGLHMQQSLRRRHAVLGEAALAALRLGEHESALRIQEEAVGIARLSGNPLDLTEGLRGRAALELRSSEPERALASLREAERELKKLGDSTLEQAVVGDLLDIEGRLLLPTNPRRALRQFIAATKNFEETDFRVRLAESYLHQALAHLALKAPSRAQAALDAGISRVESEWQWTLVHRSQGLGDDFGSGYTDTRRRLFDEMLRLLTDQAQARTSFDYAERLHSWSLLDQALRLPVSASQAPVLATGRPIQHKALLAQLPERTAILEYAQLEDRLITWIVRRGSLRMTVTPLSQKALDDQVKRFYASLSTGQQNSIEQSLTTLHWSLIGPLLRDLLPGETLVIIPDRALAAVPFSALRNRSTGRFLVQDFPLSLAPSATLYLQALRRDRVLARQRVQRALVFGDPAFDPNAFPSFRRLSGAVAEATVVASFYPDSQLLLASSATRERFLALAGSHSVVHVAAHAQTLESSPLASALALAPAGSQPGAVYAHELLQLRFTNTRLLVLSACSSARDARQESQRISGFVRPLLAAGVPAVIGTLWKVEDQAAASLMKTFHESYRRLGDAPAALRNAQLKIIETNGGPVHHIKSWAAFQVYGAAAGPYL